MTNTKQFLAWNVIDLTLRPDTPLVALYVVGLSCQSPPQIAVLVRTKSQQGWYFTWWLHQS